MPAARSENRYTEVLSSLGFSEEAASFAAQMFAEMDWAKSFETGKAPSKENEENYRTGIKQSKGPGSWEVGRGKGEMGKMKEEAETLTPTIYPKQKADWGNPPSRQLNGMQMLG